MAYRRLPNTDNARLTAIVSLFDVLNNEKGEILMQHQDMIIALKKSIKTLISTRQELVAHRTGLNKEKKILITQLKIYVSHFFQVLNFAIERGDLSKKCRIFFGLSANDGVIPSLTKEVDLLMWANNIEAGEQHRINEGMEAISHPNYKRVKEKQEKVEKLIRKIQKLEKGLEDYQLKMQKERKNIDAFIKQVWNEIEHQFINEPIEIKRDQAAYFGVVYVI